MFEAKQRGKNVDTLLRWFITRKVLLVWNQLLQSTMQEFNALTPLLYGTFQLLHTKIANDCKARTCPTMIAVQCERWMILLWWWLQRTSKQCQIEVPELREGNVDNWALSMRTKFFRIYHSGSKFYRHVFSIPLDWTWWNSHHFIPHSTLYIVWIDSIKTRGDSDYIKWIDVYQMLYIYIQQDIISG